MEILRLENQICFPIYSAAKVVDRVYQPLLNKFGITYLQYLILLMLFEEGEITPDQVIQKLQEPTQKIIPLLIRLEESGYVRLHMEGEEIMKIILSDVGSQLNNELGCVPRELVQKSGFTLERLHSLQLELSALIENFNKELDTST